MLKPRNPKPLYRSHYIYNGDTNARIAIFMREQPRLTGTPTDAELVTRPWENSHIHWFCSRNTARMHYAELRDRAQTCDVSRRILRQINSMQTVSFDADIGVDSPWEPMLDLHAQYTVEWNRTWDSSKWYEDTGPRPARKTPPEDTRPRIVLPSTGAAVLKEHADDESPFPNPLPDDHEPIGVSDAPFFHRLAIHHSCGGSGLHPPLHPQHPDTTVVTGPPCLLNTGCTAQPLEHYHVR
jgi:hypothetical protein